MFTYKIFRKPNNGSVHIRVINNRKKAEMELGIDVTEAEFEAAFSSDPKKRETAMVAYIRRVEKLIKEVQYDFLHDSLPMDMDAKEVREIIRKRIFNVPESAPESEPQPEPEQPDLFGAFYRKRTQAKTNRGYRESCEYTLKKMQAFCKDPDSDHGKPFNQLTFDDITLHWLNAFDEWLISREASQNTRNIHFKNIRTVINRALDEELTNRYPFRRFKIRPEATRKRSLSIKDLRRLFNYPVEEYQKFYLDMFKLIFMLCGINTIDLYNLERIRNGRIEYRRAKTHKLYSIKVEPEAMEIIKRWRGHNKLLCIADRWEDHRDFTKNLNIALKKIGPRKKVPGRGGKEEIIPLFPELSSYWARHSWATIARRLGVSIDDIALGLGHGDGHDLTHIYIEEDTEPIDIANRRVLDYVLYDKK